MPTPLVPVLDFLELMVGDHEFPSERAQMKRDNFGCKLVGGVTVMCTDGRIQTVPAGSVLSVWRHPIRTRSAKLQVACFFAPKGLWQMSVYGDGSSRVRHNNQATVGRRLAPSLQFAVGSSYLF